jgi:hypothetical protein
LHLFARYDCAALDSLSSGDSLNFRPQKGPYQNSLCYVQKIQEKAEEERPERTQNPPEVRA